MAFKNDAKGTVPPVSPRTEQDVTTPKRDYKSEQSAVIEILRTMRVEVMSWHNYMPQNHEERGLITLFSMAISNQMMEPKNSISRDIHRLTAILSEFSERLNAMGVDRGKAALEAELLAMENTAPLSAAIDHLKKQVGNVLGTIKVSGECAEAIYGFIDALSKSSRATRRFGYIIAMARMTELYKTLGTADKQAAIDVLEEEFRIASDGGEDGAEGD